MTNTTSPAKQVGVSSVLKHISLKMRYVISATNGLPKHKAITSFVAPSATQGIGLG